MPPLINSVIARRVSVKRFSRPSREEMLGNCDSRGTTKLCGLDLIVANVVLALCAVFMYCHSQPECFLLSDVTSHPSLLPPSAGFHVCHLNAFLLECTWSCWGSDWKKRWMRSASELLSYVNSTAMLD